MSSDHRTSTTASLKELKETVSLNCLTDRFGADNGVEIVKACEASWVVVLEVFYDGFFYDTNRMIGLPACITYTNQVIMHCSAAEYST